MSATLPPSADVVIVGGGIVGTSAAFYLASKGLSVVLCEKGAIAGESSGRAQGVVTGIGLSLLKLPLVQLSKRLYLQLNQQLGQDSGYRRIGMVSGTESPADRAFFESWLKEATHLAPDAKLLSASQARQLLPPTRNWNGAYFDPTDGGVEPTLAAPALADGAVRNGATIVGPCAVRGFETTAGALSHVLTEKGAIRTKAMILTGGAWSTAFLRNMGITLPSLSIFTTQVRMRTPARAFDHVMSGAGVGIRPMIDGSCSLGMTSGRIAITPDVLRQLPDFRKMIFNPPWDVRPHIGPYFLTELHEPRRWEMDETSPFEHNRILQPSVNAGLREKIIANARTGYPTLHDANIVETWTGAINTTPDNCPVIDRIDAVPGLFVGTGFSFGMTMGLGAGHLLAALVTDEKPEIDLTLYRHKRFVDGSELQFVE